METVLESDMIEDALLVHHSSADLSFEDEDLEKLSPDFAVENWELIEKVFRKLNFCF